MYVSCDTQVLPKWHASGTQVTPKRHLCGSQFEPKWYPRSGWLKELLAYIIRTGFWASFEQVMLQVFSLLVTSWSLECHSLYHGTFCDPYFQPQKIPWDLRAACSLKKLPNVPDIHFCLALCSGTEVMARYLIICPFAPCTVCTVWTLFSHFEWIQWHYCWKYQPNKMSQIANFIIEL